MKISRSQYVILLNIDVSGSMKGQKWRHVCENVDRLLGCLRDSDMVNALVFNRTIRFLTDVEETDELFKGYNAVENPEGKHDDYAVKPRVVESKVVSRPVQRPARDEAVPKECCSIM